MDVIVNLSERHYYNCDFRECFKITMLNHFLLDSGIGLVVFDINCAHGEVYSIQCYVIKLVSDLRQVGGFESKYSGFLHK
jgi:hypothetical protein